MNIHVGKSIVGSFIGILEFHIFEDKIREDDFYDIPFPKCTPFPEVLEPRKIPKLMLAQPECPGTQGEGTLQLDRLWTSVWRHIEQTCEEPIKI